MLTKGILRNDFNPDVHFRRVQTGEELVSWGQAYGAKVNVYSLRFYEN